MMHGVGLLDFPVSTTRRTKTDDTKPSHKTLNEIILDCFKKVRESVPSTFAGPCGEVCGTNYPNSRSEVYTEREGIKINCHQNSVKTNFLQSCMPKEGSSGASV